MSDPIVLPSTNPVSGYTDKINLLIRRQGDQYSSVLLGDLYNEQQRINASLVEQIADGLWQKVPVLNEIFILSCDTTGVIDWKRIDFLYKTNSDVQEQNLKVITLTSGRSVAMKTDQPIFNRLPSNQFGFVISDFPMYLPTSNVLPQRTEQSIKTSILQGITTITPDETAILHAVNTNTWGVIDVNRNLLDKFSESTQDEGDKELLQSLKTEILIYDAVNNIEPVIANTPLYNIGTSGISFVTYEGFILPCINTAEPVEPPEI